MTSTDHTAPPQDLLTGDKLDWPDGVPLDIPPLDIPPLDLPKDFKVDANPFGDWNTPCVENSDCASGYCVPVSETESVCTVTCVEECPEDWLCKGFGNGGPDMAFICVPPQGKLCQPCETDEDCLFQGDLCVDVGASGKFCLTSCAGAKGCPSDFTCTALVVEGQDGPSSLCFPDTESCVCTPELNGTTEACSIENEWGKCYGEKLCNGAAGWTECGALVPEEEDCDGKDNDCDGDVDEGMEPMPCVNQNEFGTCQGTQTCGKKAWECDAQVPSEEVCDGLDNDCNELIDEIDTDTDQDGDADCIDIDDDGDGVVDVKDNCPLDFNSNQADLDDDGVGDVCDDDDDNDGVVDQQDNCPEKANEDQSDVDEDQLGDACDGDIDGDGSLNQWDCDPVNPDVHPGAQEVCDGLDNNCNMFIDEGFADADDDNVADCSDPDDDNDGILDDGDNSGVTGDTPCADGQVDMCDDNCQFTPNEQQGDVDGDLVGDVCDDDADADGFVNADDCQPLNPDVYPGAAEQCNGFDDNCNGLVDESHPDFDNDLLADCIDPDDDNDLEPDEEDCAPLNPAINSFAPELCNGFDDNCDGAADEGCPPVAVRLEFVESIVKGSSGQYTANIVLGRPTVQVKAMSDEEAGYTIILGHSE